MSTVTALPEALPPELAGALLEPLEVLELLELDDDELPQALITKARTIADTMALTTRTLFGTEPLLRSYDALTA